MADGTKSRAHWCAKTTSSSIVNLPDGTRKSMARNADHEGGSQGSQEAHKAMVLKLDDPENKKMHDITAYLATIK